MNDEKKQKELEKKRELELKKKQKEVEKLEELKRQTDKLLEEE